METVNKNIIDKAMITGMFGAIGTNLRRVITILSFLGLIALNVATLVSSTVHDFLYKGLTSLPIANMSELLANSPTEKNKRIAKNLEIEKRKNVANKLKVKKVSGQVAKRTTRAVKVNLSSMFTESLPYIGIATIIGATTYEVKAACDNMKDMDDLLKSLDIAENSPETNYICGQEIPGEEKIRQSILSSEDKYADFQQNLGGFLNDFKEQSSQTWIKLKEKLIDEIFH